MHQGGFALDVTSKPDQVVIGVHGELDLRTVPWLRSELDRAAGQPSRDVCVDFSECDYFDALTVGALVTASRQLTTAGYRVIVTGVSDIQTSVLRICGLHRILTIA